MLVSEEDAASLKKWIVKRLEDISDADADVLADYVLALVKSEEPDDAVKSNCLESLEDFLRDQTPKFVDDVFEAIRLGSYKPDYVAPQATAAPSGLAFNPPTGPSAMANRSGGIPGLQNGSANGKGEQSRKRTFNDRDDGESRGDTHYQRNTGDRATKQMRRGGARGGLSGAGAGRGGSNATQGQTAIPPMPSLSSVPGMPTPPAGMPPFDPNNPLAAMLAMQAAMGFLPGFPMAGSPPAFPQVGSQNQLPPRKPGQRCRDYDTKGFCALGTACPYEHGQDPIIVPGQNEEYDPSNAKVDDTRNTNGHHSNDRSRGERGRGRGRGGFGGKGRAAFSHAGPNFDKSNMSIVVEQIPEEHFSEQHIREFFSEFGEITEVQMQPYKHLAIVKFVDYYAAKRAYDSPKVIFDNRFVKVYWYKADGVSTHTSTGPSKSVQSTHQKPDEEMVDPEEFQRKQAEAQKVQEEKKKKLLEAETQRKELEQKMKDQAEERKKLMEKLAAKTAGNVASPTTASPPKSGETAEATDKKPTSQTDALRAKLAELEAEAASLGLPAEEQYGPGYRGRGRGGYRGRGSFAPRGRGYDAYRGSWRGGRGAFSGGTRGGVMRLDNRPKKVSVKAPNLLSEKDEAFRQHLFNNYEFDAIEPHPDNKDTQIVTFKERYVAEMFIKNSDLPSVGPVEMNWYSATNGTTPAGTFTPTTPAKKDVAMGESTNGQESNRAEGGDMDYDVADDDDRWMG